MINVPLDKIDKDTINALIDDCVREDKTLDYKEKLEINSDNQKKEFLADITAFANSSGGDLVIGIREKKDINGKNTGEPEDIIGFEIPNIDELFKKMDQMIQNNIEPRLKVNYQPIEISNSKYVLVIRISKSWLSPHMITFRGRENTRFYIRDNKGKHPMVIDEIRSTFAISEDFAERIKRFRQERIGKILTDDTTLPLINRAKIVVHILPLSAFDYTIKKDVIQNIIIQDISELYPIYFLHDSYTYRYNIDGFLTYNIADTGHFYSYTQLFRNGLIESVDAQVLDLKNNKKIQSLTFEEGLISGIKRYLNFLKKKELEPPIFIFVSLIGVMGYTLAVDPRRVFLSRTDRIDRNILYLPEIVVENFEVISEKLFQPIFDAMWQSSGFERCLDYDENGEWNR